MQLVHNDIFSRSNTREHGDTYLSLSTVVLNSRDWYDNV